MASNGPFNKLERLLQYMSAEDLLNEVFQGLSDTEAYDILDHIEAMWDLSEDDEEEEEDYDDEDVEEEEESEEEEYSSDATSEVEDQTGNVVNKVLTFRRKE
jgi:hypothetical protein